MAVFNPLPNMSFPVSCFLPFPFYCFLLTSYYVYFCVCFHSISFAFIFTFQYLFLYIFFLTYALFILFISMSCFLNVISSSIFSLLFFPNFVSSAVMFVFLLLPFPCFLHFSISILSFLFLPLLFFFPGCFHSYFSIFLFFPFF